MPGATTTGASRPPTGTPAQPAGPELRSLLTRERRCAPALLVVAACAAIAALPAGVPAWAWFIAFAANLGARALLAIWFEAAQPPLKVTSPTAIAYFGSHALDLLLWGLLFGVVG